MTGLSSGSEHTAGQGQSLQSWSLSISAVWWSRTISQTSLIGSKGAAPAEPCSVRGACLSSPVKRQDRQAIILSIAPSSKCGIWSTTIPRLHLAAVIAHQGCGCQSIMQCRACSPQLDCTGSTIPMRLPMLCAASSMRKCERILGSQRASSCRSSAACDKDNKLATAVVSATTGGAEPRCQRCRSH